MLTYKRPADLIQAIPAVLEQFEVACPQAALLVVDNDPDASATASVATFAGRGVRYVHEPRPGIAAARNRALEEVPDDSLLIFIDDDERPTDQWLASLLSTYTEHRPSAVVGSVVSEYDAPLDDWMEAGRFFDRRRLPTGTVVDVAATNNLLLDVAMIGNLGLKFDERFGESGGSDTLFTRRLAALGGIMIWCDEATVIDKVPVSRLNRSWVLRRAFRSGNSWTRTSLELCPPGLGRLRARGVGAATGATRLAGGAARMAWGIVTRSLSHRVRGRRTFARGAGMCTGAFGYVYSEYSRI